MHAFPTTPRARFLCRVDFAGDPVLNIDFLDPVRDEIPFHLSLRRDEGLVVVNRRHRSGWRRELSWPLNVGDQPVEVDLRFSGRGVSLHLDGRLLGRFDGLPRPSRQGRFLLRHGFPGLDRITRLRFQGGMQWGSLRMVCPGLPPRPGGGHLTDALALEIDLPPGSGADRPALLVETGGPVPPILAPVLPRLYADDSGNPLRSAQAILPGRLWLHAIDGTLTLSVVETDGRVLATARITRADLTETITRAARSGIWAQDTLAALNAIEHVRHARLFDSLPDDVRKSLIASARGRGLRDWLVKSLPGRGAGPATAPTDEAPAPPPPNPIDAARLRILRALHAPGGDAVAQARQDQIDAPLAHAQRQLLLRSLVEPFCEAGLMPALARLVHDEGLLPLPEGTSAWEHSTLLPFDLAQGWFDAIEGRLNYLATLGDEGWTVTPAVAWTVAQIAGFGPTLDGTRPDATQRREIIRAYLHYLDGQQGQYWSRSPCRALMDALVGILARPDWLRTETLRRAARTALQLWGLSPRFWSSMRAAGVTDLPAYLAEGAEICAALMYEARAETPDRSRIDTLLTRAEALQMADALRFRRELLGPTYLPYGPPVPDALKRRGLDPDEACLRALTHPDAPAIRADTPPALEPPILQAAARGLAAAYVQLPGSQLYGLEQRLMTQARTLLANPRPDAPPDAPPNPRPDALTDALTAWSRDLVALSGPDQNHAGVALALGLAAGLARDGARHAAEALIALPPLTGIGADRVGLSPAGGPAHALAVLARHAPDLAARAGAALSLTRPGSPVQALRDSLPPGPTDPQTQLANPLHDTLVAVYSCRANLKERVPELRNGWLRELTAMGIPWLIFTGDGDGTRDDDIVHLDAPDDYEGLPAKTVALVRWVLTHTHASRLLKVDDDCFLHAPAWFGDLAHLRHDYYGRALTLMPGQMNRTWHMAKSRTERGRLGLDKSPEPSRYADGGSGYMLSRRAMAALIDAADSPEGQQLQQVSFMEDKQTGDLLALRGITISGEDYRTGVWRQTGPGGPLVPAWENGVLPFRGSPVKLVHLDDSLHQTRTLTLSRRDWPQAGKVWPSFQPALCGSRTNTLDLLSSPGRLARARNAPLAVIACLRNEAQMLPLFLEHYRRLGVEAFLIADNGSDDGTLDMLAHAPDVALFSVDTEYNRSQYGVAWQQALMANFRVGKWSLMADADELLVWSDDPAARLPALLAEPGFAQADAARVLMLDMYPRGPLSDVTLETGNPIAETGFVDREPFLRISTARGPYSDAETLTSALRHRLLPGSRPELFVAQKIALLRYRPWMRLSAGLHYVAETRLARRDLMFAHVKYTAAFRAKALAEVQRRQHFNDAEEYRKYLALLAEGQETLFDPALSVPWRDCPEVRRVFAASAIAADAAGPRLRPAAGSQLPLPGNGPAAPPDAHRGRPGRGRGKRSRPG